MVIIAYKYNKQIQTSLDNYLFIINMSTGTPSDDAKMTRGEKAAEAIYEGTTYFDRTAAETFMMMMEHLAKEGRTEFDINKEGKHVGDWILFHANHANIKKILEANGFGYKFTEYADKPLATTATVFILKKYIKH